MYVWLLRLLDDSLRQMAQGPNLDPDLFETLCISPIPISLIYDITAHKDFSCFIEKIHCLLISTADK